MVTKAELDRVYESIHASGHSHAPFWMWVTKYRDRCGPVRPTEAIERVLDFPVGGGAGIRLDDLLAIMEYLEWLEEVERLTRAHEEGESGDDDD